MCRAPVEPGAETLVVTASFGLAVATPDDAPDELVRRADAAMYRAKAMGGAQVVVFDDGAEVQHHDARRRARGRGQPWPDPAASCSRSSTCDTGVLVGYQGLARWEHPQRGLLDAEQFVHVVANTPILPVVDLAVLRRTAAAAARTARSGLRVRAYGHLSRRLIGDVDVERYLTEIVDDLGIAPSDLCVEIAHALVARPIAHESRARCAPSARSAFGPC